MRAPGRSRGRGGREGAALVVAVLLSLALLGLGHALLVSAEGAYVTSRAHARLAEAEALATGRLEDEALLGWRGWMDSVAVGDGRPPDIDVRGAWETRIRWRRLTPEAWLVDATVERGAVPATHRRRLLWLYDPGSRIAALPGVVSTGLGAPVSVAGAVVSDGPPPLGAIGGPSLGLLTISRLLMAADSVGPSGTPTPSDVGGVCETALVWNWGDPIRPYRPCGSHGPLKGRRGSVVVDGGEGQGVLVVDGDVTLSRGALFHGLVLASGSVEVAGGSVVEGRVVAMGGITVDAASRIVGDGVRAVQALQGVRPALGEALPLHPAPRLGSD